MKSLYSHHLVHDCYTSLSLTRVAILPGPDAAVEETRGQQVQLENVHRTLHNLLVVAGHY